MTALPHDETLARIEAVATALAAAPEPARAALLREYLDLVAHFLMAQGAGDRQVSPLLDLIEKLDAEGSVPTPKQIERREGREASDEILARLAAVIDVLIASGYTLDHACQLATRQLITRNVRPPDGGDARAWRNVQSWRHRLLNSPREGAVWNDYVVFKNAMMQTYGAGVAAAVTREAVWERRHPADG